MREMDPTEDHIGSDNALPAESTMLERLLLVLAVLSAGLVFLPLTADTALLHLEHHWS